MNKTIVIECKSCSGTGLYKGMAERDNCAVVCSECKGTGKVDFIYKEFKGRKLRADVKRVFKGSYGYIQSDVDITEGSKRIRFSDGGCTYEEWLKGAEPKPVKDLYCPYQWDNRGMGNEPLEDCKEYCIGGGWIADYRNYHNKNKCWEKLEKGER